MKNMNNRKRVSFGSKGSMVETWIIDDFTEQHGENEGHFYRNNLVNIRTDSSHDSTPEKNRVETKVTFCDTPVNDSRPVQAKPVLSSPNRSPSPVSSSPPPPGVWPLKRSQSLESRDNPFIPGGELSKETDDLLKRATIIRDKFYLDEFGNMVPCDGPDSPGRTGETFDTNDKHCVEENMSAEVANSAQASPKPRVNGKLDGSASPDAVKVDMKEQADGNASADDSQKDKKKQKKCCSVM